jgi:hypothetical protein
MIPADPLAIRAELARVLASPGFAHNERLSRFLRFVVERHLEGREDEIKESVIGVEVFNRRSDFDPRLDSVVRTDVVGWGRAAAIRLLALVDREPGTEIALPPPELVIRSSTAPPRRPGAEAPRKDRRRPAPIRHRTESR